jgi:hypothetical protein
MLLTGGPGSTYHRADGVARGVVVWHHQDESHQVIKLLILF